MVETETMMPSTPWRRHSLGISTGVHRHLIEEDALGSYVDKLRHLHDVPEDLRKIFSRTRPESPSDATPAKDKGASNSLDLLFGEDLASQTLDDIFEEQTHETAIKRRHSLGSPDLRQAEKELLATGYDLHAPHQLSELRDHLVHAHKSPKIALPESPPDSPAEEAPIAAPVHAERSSSPLGPALWLQALTRRKAEAAKLAPTGAATANGPPPGWTPTLNSIMAVLKLRKLHATRAAAAARTTVEAEAQSTANQIGVAFDEIYRLADPTNPGFDVHAFIEECWITQAATDPRRVESLHQFMATAYDQPLSQPVGVRQLVIGAPPRPPSPPPYPLPQPNAYQQVVAPVPLPPPRLPQTATPHMVPPPGMALPQAAVAPAGFAAPPSMAAYAPPPLPAQHPPTYMAQHPSMATNNAGAKAWAPAPWAPVPWAGPAGPPPMLARGSLAAMAHEQEGSRQLQQQLMRMAPAELAAAVDELAPHLLSLATNAFGNYLVSAMAGLPAAHGAVHAALSGHVCRLMQHPQGSRVAQAALERLPAHLACDLTSELEHHVVEVANGTHGSWSVVAAYKRCRPRFVIDELAMAIRRLSTQQNGSRVVQRVLTEAAMAGEDLSAPVSALLALGGTVLVELAEDKFGNYVVQLALRHAPSTLRDGLLARLLPRFAALAVGKCSSNVAEAVVEVCSAAQLHTLREGLGSDGIEALRGQLYGTYVVNALDGRRP